jgi:predicted permease
MAIASDLRYAIRLLIRTPAFTIPAVCSLALGIALNTTVFSVYSALILRPIGRAGSGHLVRIGQMVNDRPTFRSYAQHEFEYLRSNISTLDVLGHQLETVTMNGPDGSEFVSTEIVTANYFSVLGALPTLGRGFAPDEDGGAGARAVAVISDRFWRRRFGADPGIVGSTVPLVNHPFTIVGVGPSGFTGTFPGVDMDAWLPVSAAEIVRTRKGARGQSLSLMGRLKPHVSIEAARAELEVLARRMADEVPNASRRGGFVLASARGAVPGLARLIRVFLLLMLASAGVVLLIVCANVASLMLARANARYGELAVRLALGSSRSRLVAQLLVESGLLALLGGAAGLLLTEWTVRFLNTLAIANGPTGTPIFLDLQLDARVLLFNGAATTATILMFGLVPALQATRVNLVSALKEAASLTGRQRSRWRGGLIVLQVAFSFVLLVASALLFRSLRHVANLDVGFNPDQVLVASFDLQTMEYPEDRIVHFYEELLQRARAVPGIQRAALADFIPMADRERADSIGVQVPGATPHEDQEAAAVSCARISDGYFGTMQQPLLRGRDFTSADDSDALHVAIVNQAMARRFWPGEDSLGRVVRLAGESAERQIVGVVADAKFASFGNEREPFLYFPARQRSGSALTLHVRTSIPAPEVFAIVRRLVREIDVGVAPYNRRTLWEAMAFRLIPVQVAHAIFGTAGAIGLLLACGGLYGLICYTLEQRMKEIGIRVALGASRSSVFRAIVGRAMGLTVSGIAIGIGLGIATARVLTGLVYGVSPTDPAAYAAIVMLFLTVALAAGYAAARKGLNVDPVVALRHE